MSAASPAAARWTIGKAAALNYDRGLVPVLFKPWARELVKRSGIGQGDQVLDVACGTGAVALEAARAVGLKGAVCGLDPNDAMLRRARLQTKATRVSVRWHTGDAESLPFRQRRFDAVLCQHGVQFFGDRKRGIHEMVRVLRSGGRVLASVWGPLNRNPWASAIIAGFEAVCPEWAQSMRAPFSMAEGRELQELLAADCSTVRLERVQLDLAMPDPGAFVRHFLAALPFADQMECDVEKLAAAILAGLETGRNRRSTVPSEVWIASGVA